ncbi:hypothetical protein BU17DRAFT_51381 [Hysterangium stoloniferum]|nr:hypothetical protein BU17DRAFT_51381 [Hysterangium stoloniferum]
MDHIPKPPTSSLPPLRNIIVYSRSTIIAALLNLRALYWPASVLGAAIRTGRVAIAGKVPDSGYASAEEDEHEYTESEEAGEERLMLMRVDAFEKAFAAKWLTGFIARSEEWVDAGGFSLSLDSETPQECEDRACVVEEVAALLALLADTHADGALARKFSFAVEGGGQDVTVELKDESYDQDHASVGLQTWGSACVLAGRICMNPGRYLPLYLEGAGTMNGGGGASRRQTVRVLELGAGTGLLSMVVAKLHQQLLMQTQDVHLDVVATDFHPAVLKNLRSNVLRNFSFNGKDSAVYVDKLDWADTPVPAESDKFDVILAADVIYDKRHGGWIKACAEQMLRESERSLMWLIVPRRPTRTGEVEGVDDVFCKEGQVGLGIIEVENVARHHGVGRADEDGYRLFKIGWAL